MAIKLFIITASQPESYKHYIDTIEEGFSLTDIEQFLSEEDLEKIKIIFGNKKIHAWGGTPGSGNVRTWNNLDVDDRIIIYRKLNYEYVATVAYKFHNKELAKHLWGNDSEGQTWEYMYLLDNVTELSVPASEFNKVVNYASNYFPQGFTQISGNKLTPLLDRFGSIDEFLNYLAEGKWVELKKDIPEPLRKEIIQEKVSRQISHTEMLEENLEDFIAEHINQIEGGLKLIARQKVTDVGRIDLLCSNHDLVIIELKRGKASSSVVEQIQRYMGWVMKHMAEEGKKVRGIIIVGKKDTYLEYAAAANPLI